MTTNFDFLKKVDKNLFEIISDAERLYRDEYFEQCMTQTRRFGEHVCKKVLGTNRTTENTFDDMLATLKDCSTGRAEEQEFITDLYYLKKHGNSAVHSSSVRKDGITALECLKRAFETAISYCVYYKGKSQDILKLQYDTELLVTAKKNKSLSEKYTEAKQKAEKQKRTKPSDTTIKVKKRTKQQHILKAQKPDKFKLSFYWIFVGISFFISLLVFMFMFFSIKFGN